MGPDEGPAPFLEDQLTFTERITVMRFNLEFLIVHVLLVAGVLVMSWGPVVYMLRVAQLHTGGF